MEDATTALKAMSITQQPKTSTTAAARSDVAPRANFPLPRELRDHIFGYLLDAEEVMAASYGDLKCRDAIGTATAEDATPGSRNESMAHTYNFHPDILAVNMAIYKEAADIFYKNDFIVVKHAWPKLKAIKHQHDLPIVSECPNQVCESMAHAALVLYMRHPEPDGVTWDGMFTLVRRDLPAFRRMMQWILKQVSTPFELVHWLNGEEQLCTVGVENDIAMPVVTDVSFQGSFGSQKSFAATCKEIRLLSVPGHEVKVYTKGKLLDDVSKSF